MSDARAEVLRLVRVARLRRLRSWAFAHVPYYREEWGRSAPADGRGPDAEDLDGQRFRLSRVGDPWREDAPAESRDLRALPAMLVAAGALPAVPTGPGVLLAECTLAADDLARLPLRYGVGYLAVPARGPAVRSVALGRLAAARRAVVVGTATELSALARPFPPEVVGRWLRVARTPAGDAGPSPGATLLHDPFLGDVAVRRTSCGSWHVPSSAWWVRQGDSGPLLSRPRRAAPVLVDVRARSLTGWRVSRCPRHGGAVLVAG